MHSPEFRAKAIAAYVTEGNITRAAKSVNIARDTLRGWLGEYWAKKLLERLHEEHTRELVNEVRAVASLALDKVRGGLENPNISARDAAVVFGILSEKAVLWSERVTRENEPITPDLMDKLDAQAEMLRAEYLKRKMAELSKDAVEH